MHLPAGLLLQNGKYKLVNIVGQGGFGITYKGVWFTEVKGSLGKIKTEVPVCIKEYFFKDYCLRDPDTNAVKVHSETGKILFEKFKEKLIKEARILSDVHHPYIVNVLEVFEENETAYIVMEYIAGSSLKERLEQVHTLSENRTLKYIHQAGEALQFVHEKNILHLDIKPSNILIDGNDQARLIDFGVSKRYDIEQQETSTTMLTLSKGFASIEQYDDEGMLSFSPCPDIYSLGATMYNLLTGKIPTESILRATKDMVEPKELNPAISEKTNAVILKAMKVVPTDRFQTVREMLDALDMPVPEPEEELLLTSATNGEESETTLLYTSLKQTDDADSDVTVLNQPAGNQQVPVRKRRKAFMPLLIIAVTVLASAGVLYVYNQPSSDKTPSLLMPSDSLPQMETAMPVMPENQDIIVADEPSSTSFQPEATPVTKQTDTSLRQTAQTTQSEEALSSSEPAKSSSYDELLESGKRKMDIGDYDGAIPDLASAREIQQTEEVNQLINTALTRSKDQKVAQKKALYEEKMSLGLYTIVRQKSSGLYGAIDNEGNEVIPCIYQNVFRSENGRAFQRNDNLFDIYDQNVRKINERVANY